MFVTDSSPQEIAHAVMRVLVTWEDTLADLRVLWSQPFEEWPSRTKLAARSMVNDASVYAGNLAGRRVYLAEKGYLIVARRTPVDAHLQPSLEPDDVFIQLPGATPATGQLPNLFVYTLGGQYAVPQVST